MAAILSGFNPSDDNLDSFFYLSSSFTQALPDQGTTYNGIAVLDRGCVSFITKANQITLTLDTSKIDLEAIYVPYKYKSDSSSDFIVSETSIGLKYLT